MLPTLALVLIVVHGAYGGHFRGGSMSWVPIDNGNKVEVTLRVGYTFDNTRKGHCTREAWEEQTLLETDRELLCDSCTGADYSRTLYWTCTDFDEVDNWSSGSNVTIYDVHAGKTRFEIKYEDCCWVNTVSPDTGRGKNSWNLLAEVNVQPRPDGRINSSPVAAPIALEKYYRGTVYELDASISDPDGDLFRCDYFEYLECADQDRSYPSKSCGPPTSGLTVHPNCSLIFNTENVAAGQHAVNIMIRDCPDEACTNPYSKIPLLFLLHVTEEEGKKPLIISQPPCQTLRLGELFEMVIVAEAGDELKPISKIVAYNKPYGMIPSALQSVPNNDLRKYITLSWTPDKIGQYLVSYSAHDSEDYTSGMSSTFLYVEETPLAPDSSSSFPAANSDTVKEGDTWVVQFNNEIRRPTTSALIQILHLGEPTFTVDATDPSVVFYEDRFEFVPSNALSTGTQQLQLDPGVAMPKTGGGCGSKAASWPFDSEGGIATRSPPTRRTNTPPQTHSCTVETVVIPGTAKEGDECFIHLQEGGHVVVVGPDGTLTTSLYICCPGECGYSPPATRGPPGVAP